MDLSTRWTGPYFILPAFLYCSDRWRVTDVGGSGAGSPQTLQKRALERFICPHGQGRRLAVVVDCGDCGGS
ncbi:MAG TPA: hypothetical protein VH593_25785, partial [Ktedonobacteraceae bacterium]